MNHAYGIPEFPALFLSPGLPLAFRMWRKPGVIILVMPDGIYADELATAGARMRGGEILKRHSTPPGYFFDLRIRNPARI